MKKIVAFIVAFLYLGLTTGLAINIDYCMNKIAQVKLYSLDDQKCSCNSKEKMPCCRHDHKLVKVNDEHQQAGISYTIPPPPARLSFSDIFFTYSSLFSLQIKYTKANDPPLLTPLDIYIYNCVFRI